MSLKSQIMTNTVTKHLCLAYYVHLPIGFDPMENREWPVVIFLHGAGERGSDLTFLKKHGLVQQVAEGQEFPFILVAPQCPKDWTWDRSLDELDALLEEILHTYPVDCERIYLTGLSMGGYGTWHWAVRHPDAFAALVPICGGTMPLLGFPEKITKLKHIPIWVFHGRDDQVVPIKRSEELVDVLLQAGSPVRFTQYEGVGHNSWSLAYREQELIPWLLKQRNSQFSFAREESVE